jgi:hypothetical protein
MCIDNNRGYIPFAAIAVFIILMTLSCRSPLTQEPAGQDPSLVTQGTVTLSIPCVSPVLQALHAEVLAKTSASRAYAFADRMTIVVHSGGTEIDSLDISVATSGSNLVAAMLLDPGTYTATVEIYNHQNSIDNPVVRGVKEFTVTANTTTPVSVGCIPIDPVPLGGVYQTPTLEPGLRNNNSNFYYSFGSEVWYSFTAEETEARLKHLSVDSGNFIVALYDSTGRNKGSAINLYYESSAITFSDLTIGETYYLLCTSYDRSTDGNSTFNDNGIYQIKLQYNMYESITPSVSEGAFMALAATTDNLSFVLADTSALTLSLVLRSGVSASWNGTPIEDASVTIAGAGTITFSDGTETQAVSVSLTSATTMPLDEAWTDVSASSSTSMYSAVPVSSGIPILVEWNSTNDGDGSYSGYCYLSAYDMGTGTSYFTSGSYGYGSNARMITPAADGYLLLKVISYYSSLQTIGLRVYEKVNRSPAVTSGSTFSLVQTMSSSTSSQYIFYSDPDGDSIGASISCTEAPPEVDMASVISSSNLYDSYGYVYVQRNLPAGEYTLTLVLNDGQDFDGLDGVNAPSRVEIPITMTITNMVPVLSLSADYSLYAIGTTVSLSFSVPLDPDLDSDSLAFSIKSAPEGATVTISDGAFTVESSSITGTATFTPDVAGKWIIAVTGTEASEPVSGTVTFAVYSATQGGVEFNVQ